MKELFPGFYQPTDHEFKKLWEKCTFVLDANVLLNLYRYPEEAKADLLKVIGKISDRLWLPYQAALEYQRNRLTVIAEQQKKFSDVKEAFDAAESKLIGGLEKLQLKKKYSSINPEGFL